MRLARVGVAVAVLLMVAGCGLLGGTPEQEHTPNSKVEDSEINVTLCCGALDVLPFHYANETGIFKRRGLTVRVTQAPDGGSAVTKVVSGEADVAFASYPPMLLAESQKVAEGRGGLKVIAGATTLAPENTVLAVRQGSAITRPEQLGGKRIGVTATGTMTQFLAESTARGHLVNPKTIEWVPVPFPSMAEALSDGSIDAAIMTEPFLTQAWLTHQRINAVWDMARGPDEGIPIGGYVASGDFVKRAPRTIAAFQRALNSAAAEVTRKRDTKELVELMGRVSQGAMTEDMAHLLRWTNYETSVNGPKLQEVEDLMVACNVKAVRPLDMDAMFIPLPK